MCIYSFFFSSRRRHTRWPRDWSSDVCSSDLGPARAVLDGASGVHDEDVVGHLGDHTQVVGDHDDRRPEIALQEIGRASCRERVERGGVDAWIKKRKKGE